MADSPLGTIGMVATSFYVADLDKAIAWYGDKLGLEPMMVGKDGHRYASFSMGGSIVVLEPIDAALEPQPLGAENTTLNVLVDADPVDVHAELTTRGVYCSALAISPNFVSFLVRDLDGNRFYISRAATEEARRSVEGLST
jgi:catechol 2,3-dioxygenase-like lactoylglutathione lyase family enzyme